MSAIVALEGHRRVTIQGAETSLRGGDRVVESDVREIPHAYRLAERRFEGTVCSSLQQFSTIEMYERSWCQGEGRLLPAAEPSTREACRILHLDTRRTCRLYNEGATDRLVKQVDANLRFRRNCRKLRPCAVSREGIIEYV
jgi:hypothetical protein